MIHIDTNLLIASIDPTHEHANLWPHSLRSPEFEDEDDDEDENEAPHEWRRNVWWRIRVGCL
jgi:hypothetical protein